METNTQKEEVLTKIDDSNVKVETTKAVEETYNLDELYARRQVTQDQLDSINELIAKLEAVLSK